MTLALFVVGAPGAGKTTLVRAMLDLLDPRGERYLHPKPKLTIAPRFIAAGHYTGSTFDGADTVPYNGKRALLDHLWGSRILRDLLLFDGDRFSDKAVWDEVAARGDVATVWVLNLQASASLLAERRAQRGSNQNESWMRGRETKARRFAADRAGLTTTVIADDPAELDARLILKRLQLL